LFNAANFYNFIFLIYFPRIYSRLGQVLQRSFKEPLGITGEIIFGPDAHRHPDKSVKALKEYAYFCKMNLEQTNKICKINRELLGYSS